ncbi:MAG: glycosyltransferase family 10 [Methylococcaceae bacterium]|jgi:hypothetical protein
MTYKFFCFRSNYCPFNNSQLISELIRHGYVQGSIFDNNLIICRNQKNARLATLFFPFSKVIIWTHEPRYDSTDEKIIKGFFGKQINVFNVFTGDVFWHNNHFLGSYHYDESNNLGINNQEMERSQTIITEENFEKRKILSAIFEKKDLSNFDYIVNSINVDATKIRQDIAMAGFNMGICDIAGKGWGEIAIEESGFNGSNVKPWWIRKIDLISKYRFNVSIENTIWPYYVTEKIWQSIIAYSLPVYWGENSSIYETFPHESFIDASLFLSPEDLCNYLKTMSYSEWVERMNKCIDTYNQEVLFLKNSGKKPIDEVIERINTILK